LPEVDHVVGLNRLADLVQAVRGELPERIAVDDLRAARSIRTLGADVFTGQTRAFLKVQEGCNLFCSFCIVPFSRGASRSVAPRDVLAQLQHLADRGFQEVVLTGVHLGGYGADLAPRRELADLLEMILEHDCMPRLRLSSIDPPEVTPRLLRLFRAAPALCAHFHIPVQAADDEVLRRMRRKYDSSFLRELTASIRETLPDAAIGTDVIGGFPGETDEQFERGLQRLEQMPFTYFHVFPYSKRSGTTAAKLPGQLPAQVVQQRATRLRQLGEAKRAEFAQHFVGRTLEVLLEEGSRSQTSSSGYSRNYQRVAVHGAATANREIAVRVTAARAGRLLGNPA
jgi:threonylcarbamoyladenosine tRNA methylthiotransferase MtaB